MPPVAPQDVVVKVWSKEAGGGCVYVWLGLPSLYTTVYKVPNGLFLVLVVSMKKVFVDGKQSNVVLPEVDNPIPGFDPIYTEYSDESLHPPEETMNTRF